MPFAPAIACVIPVHNGKATLRRALDSVLSQRDDVLAVVVDDGSTDGTGDLAAEWSRADPRIVAVRFSSNLGRSAARNVGVAVADAPCVAFLDADDEHMPGWYDFALRELEASPGCAAIKGGFELAGLAEGRALAADDPRRSVISESVIWDMIVRKPVYQALGGCPAGEAFRIGGEDVAFMMVLTRHFRVTHTDYPATIHHVRPDGATDHFLRRTHRVGSGFKFVEGTAGEQDRTLEAALPDHRRVTDANLELLRAAFFSSVGDAGSRR